MFSQNIGFWVNGSFLSSLEKRLCHCLLASMGSDEKSFKLFSSPIVKASFLSHCLQDFFSMSLEFSELWLSCVVAWISLGSSSLEHSQLLESVGMYLMLDLGSFQPSFLWIPCLSCLLIFYCSRPPLMTGKLDIFYSLTGPWDPVHFFQSIFLCCSDE